MSCSHSAHTGLDVSLRRCVFSQLSSAAPNSLLNLACRQRRAWDQGTVLRTQSQKSLSLSLSLSSLSLYCACSLARSLAGALLRAFLCALSSCARSLARAALLSLQGFTDGIELQICCNVFSRPWKIHLVWSSGAFRRLAGLNKAFGFCRGDFGSSIRVRGVGLKQALFAFSRPQCLHFVTLETKFCTIFGLRDGIELQIC